jgi:DNA recombination protein RmuC
MIAQVQSVQLAEEQLRKETSTLVKALAKPQVRGAWGELQLKRTVELAGMVDHCDFILQDTSTSDDKTIRPDMKVNLVGGKFLYVDSKTPLQGFLDAEAANTDEGYATGMEGFAKHVREHIRQLSSKNYWKADVGSPEFVILFLPSEALLQLALEYAPDLIEFAAPKNIMLATPTTLITTLRSVAYAWTQDSLAESAKEVTGLGRELYERLATMGGHFDKLARGLDSAVGAYNDAVGSLEGRVLVSARKLRDLKVSEAELKELPLVTSGTRPLSAGELVDSAQEIPTTVVRSRALTAVQEVSSGSDGEGQPLDRVSL